MNTLTPFAPSLTKPNRRPSASQPGNARLLAPRFTPCNENRMRLSVTQAERLLAQATTLTGTAFVLPISRSRVTWQKIESALLTLLFVSIAITFGLLMTT